MKKETQFVNRLEKGQQVPNKTDSALAIVKYYQSINPDIQIKPNSLLHKLSVEQYNEQALKMDRPQIPAWFCGYINPTTGEILENPTDDQLRNDSGFIQIQSKSTIVESISGKGYIKDACLTRGTPGSVEYSKCGRGDDAFTSNSADIANNSMGIDGSDGVVESPENDDNKWIKKINQQMMFFAAPQYFFRSVTGSALTRWLSEMASSGLTGPSIEFGGPFIVYEYIGEGRPVNLATEYKASFNAFKEWLPLIRKHNMVAHMYFLNSNQSAASKQSDSWWEALAKDFAKTFGWNNIIMNIMNENDRRTRPSIATAIQKGLKSEGWPASQLIGYGNKFPKENHTFDDMEGSSYVNFNVTDNGPAIEKLYGSNWTRGGTPNVANIKKFVGLVKRSRTSGAVYGFGRVPDYVGLRAAAQAWKS